VALKDEGPTVDGVAVGDRLVKIDDLDVSIATRGAILSALCTAIPAIHAY